MVNAFATFYLDFKKSILLITIKKSQPTEDEWDMTKTTMKKYYKLFEQLGTKFSMIFNLLEMGLLSLKYYNDWADLFIEYKSKTEQYILATSIVVQSTVVRYAINAFFAIYTTVRPMKITYDEKESLNFINSISNIK
jgi:hypothetical protein